jgi:hypothetical protein
MTTNFKSFALAALVLASLTANAVVVPHSKTIVVESPETQPILAEANPEAMYLHDTNDGRTLLYIEAENGRKLISLDVTDPSRIQRFTQSELPATSAYDFVRDLGDSSVLIRYRNGSGVALIKQLNAPNSRLLLHLQMPTPNYRGVSGYPASLAGTGKARSEHRSQRRPHRGPGSHKTSRSERVKRSRT